MSSSLDKLRALTSRLEDKIEEKEKVSSVKSPEAKVVKKTEKKPLEKVVKKVKENCDNVREENIARVKELYEKLKIFEKSPDFEKVFVYKAMNLSGIGLKEDDFGEVREGKYIQVIAITYEPDKNGK